MAYKIVFNPFTTSFDYVSSGSSSGGTSYDQEVPTGAINGLNTSYTLANTPVSGSEHGFLNGARLKRGDDYTISGNTITMSFAPPGGSNFFWDYRA